MTGIDVDTEQIQAAAAAANGLAAARFLAADATRLPFADGEFDVVYSNKTTHHIREWQQAFTEMTRVLKPDGHLVYSDFVAPLGHRLPTRGALNRLADQRGLQTVRRSGSLFQYTGVFRKVNTNAGMLHRSNPRSARAAPKGEVVLLSALQRGCVVGSWGWLEAAGAFGVVRGELALQVGYEFEVQVE